MRVPKEESSLRFGRFLIQKLPRQMINLSQKEKNCEYPFRPPEVWWDSPSNNDLVHRIDNNDQI